MTLTGSAGAAKARREAYTELLRGVTAVHSAHAEAADALRADIPDPDECARLFGAARAPWSGMGCDECRSFLQGPGSPAQVAFAITSVNQK